MRYKKMTWQLKRTLLCIPFACTTVAQAQQTSADEQMEVIEVYAQKRAQQASDVGVSITYIGEQQLTDAAIKDTTELGRFSANVKISQNAAEGTPPAINIRGVGLIDYNTANTSPVGLYVDGVNSGSASHQIANLYDIQQVEVLKGPQGTLFGRNTTGGAILVRTARPEFDNYGYVKGAIGSDDWRQAQLVGNMQLSEQQALRVALNHQKYDYTSYNLAQAYPEAGLEQNDARVSYLGQWQQLNWFTKVEYSRWQGLTQPVGNIGIISPSDGSPCTLAQINQGECVDAFGFNDGSDDFWAVKVNNNNAHETTRWGLTNELGWQVNTHWQALWLLGVSDLERDHGFNCDGSLARLCEGNLGLQTRSLSNELRLQGHYQQHHITLGAYQLSEQIEQLNNNDLLRDFRGILDPSLTANFLYDNEIDTRSWALFAHAQWQLSPRWALVTGVRYSDETVEYDSVSTLNVPIAADPQGGITIDYYQVSGQQDDDGVSTELALHYTDSRDNLYYYRYSDGHKSGGYNGGFLSTPEQAQQANYGPEQLSAHEIGFKTPLMRSGFGFDGAIFYYQYDDQQVFMNQASANPQQPPLQLLENVASSRISGAELAMHYRPKGPWRAHLALGYIPNAEFEQYTDPLGNTLTDHRLPFTSKWNINGALAYSWAWTNVDMRAGVSFDFQSDYYFDQNENPIASQGDYTLWDAHIVADYQQWQARLWAKNVFDTHYSHLKFDLSEFLGMYEDFKGEGRRVGLDVTFHF
tara:strand:- start:3479 stop:5734 length:2256 start_codon:yes stop_codon:yes gene_type:complete